MNKSMLKRGLFSSVAVLAIGATAIAEEDKKENTLEEIVVTGTSAARSSLDAPMSVSQYGEEDLRKLSFNSQADILRTIPSIKAEGGGGEVASNVFIKGLPSGGQYQFTPLQFDGMPAFSTFGLNSSAFDVYYRPDMGIERFEFVRGGVSNLFGTGSVAGIINYISKTGSDTPESVVQLEWAEENRFRGDFATSGPLTENTYYALSGFYRYDEGPIDTGLPTDGMQLRGNIKRDFEDGSGSFTLYGQYIDDKVQFFLPYPLDGETRDRPTGNDGRKIYTLQTREAEGLSYQTPDGVFKTPIRDGVATKGGTIGMSFEKDFGDGWGVNARTKYSDYDHQFNLFLDGDGLFNTPETQAGFLEARGYADLQAANFSFTQSGQALGANDLVFANRLLDRKRDAEDFTGELNLTKEVNMGGFDHTFTFGSFFSRSEAEDINYLTTYLGDFTDQPSLVDLTVTNADGSETIVSNNGLLNAVGRTGNNFLTAKRYAFYAADQFENDKWVFDIGFRFEKMIGDFSREGRSSFQIDDNPNLSDDLANVQFGNGSFTLGEVSDTEWAVALGALYRVNDNVNVYGNFSRGFFFPQLRSVKVNELGETASYDAEIIEQAEVGVKFSGEKYQLTLAGFYASLDDRANVDFVNDGMGGVTEQTSFQSTETFGIEATASYFITENLRFDGNITLQDHEFKEFDGNEANIGNELRRQPNLLFNTSLAYDDDMFDIAISHNYVGSNFANDSNSVKLGSYNIVRLDAGYKLKFGQDEDQSVRLGVGIFNLFDEEGVTEGSPRQGSNQSNTGAFFVGRPILPRRVSVRLTYDF